MAQVVESVHEQYAKGRRAQVLARHFAQLIPPGSRVLDVGTGDGTIAASVLRERTDVAISGLEIQPREDCAIPAGSFDGKTLPFADGSFDYVSFVDVLHHTEDPMVLLREGCRVARRGLLIKDHLRRGFLGGGTLAFMDKVGNRRYGIQLPNTYLSPAEWEAAFGKLDLEAGEWRGDLGIYPAWADWWFGRGLHFFARLEKQPEGARREVEHWHPGLSCCNEKWEAAYERFESPSEEREKFRRRFRQLGIDKLPRDASVVDLFCGRGNGLSVLREWGFIELTGVDLSPELLRKCPEGVRLVVADCRELRFPENSVDAFIVQGGLHHLPRIPEDLEACLLEVHRSLKKGGTFFVVEPWSTPYLRAVHAITRMPVIRKRVARFDAFATMVEEEWETYAQWLSGKHEILDVFDRTFPSVRCTIGWGKCALVASTSSAEKTDVPSSR